MVFRSLWRTTKWWMLCISHSRISPPHQPVYYWSTSVLYSSTIVLRMMIWIQKCMHIVGYWCGIGRCRWIGWFILSMCAPGLWYQYRSTTVHLYAVWTWRSELFSVESTSTDFWPDFSGRCCISGCPEYKYLLYYSTRYSLYKILEYFLGCTLQMGDYTCPHNVGE